MGGDGKWGLIFTGHFHEHFFQRGGVAVNMAQGASLFRKEARGLFTGIRPGLRAYGQRMPAVGARSFMDDLPHMFQIFQFLRNLGQVPPEFQLNFAFPYYKSAAPADKNV